MILVISITSLTLGLFLLLCRRKAVSSKIKFGGALLIVLFGLSAGIYVYSPNLIFDLFSSETDSENPAQPDKSSKESDENARWSSELTRQKNIGVLYYKQLENSEADKKMIYLAIANNHQLKAIANRHLKRFPDAIDELNKSQELLAVMEKEYRCGKSAKTDSCYTILYFSAMTSSFFYDVYENLNNEANMIKYCRSALEFYFKAYEEAVLFKNEEGKERSHVAAKRIYNTLAISISWMPDGVTLKSSDPRDFADVHGLSIGSSWKYGMTDFSEDEATFATAVFLSKMYRKDNSQKLSDENPVIEDYVRDQMAEGNFEVAAKYLRYTYIDLDFTKIRCIENEKYLITFDEVNAAIAGTPELKYSQWTREVIELLEYGYNFFQKNCQKSETSNEQKQESR